MLLEIKEPEELDKTIAIANNSANSIPIDLHKTTRKFIKIVETYKFEMG